MNTKKKHIKINFSISPNLPKINPFNIFKTNTKNHLMYVIYYDVMTFILC